MQKNLYIIILAIFLLITIDMLSVSCSGNKKLVMSNLKKNDTVYFVRNNFEYCDSIRPHSCKYKNGIFYETDKINIEGEDKLIEIVGSFENPPYFIFITKKRKVIEEGQLVGIKEVAFNQGLYKAYYPNENLFCKGYYVDGKKIDKWVYYNEKGIMSKEEIYDEGGLIETTKTGR